MTHEESINELKRRMAREKARGLRYKKPIAKGLNIYDMMQKLEEIGEACAEVKWYEDQDEGDETLLAAMNGDLDEVYEFKMAFADLEGEAQRMYADMQAMFNIENFAWETEFDGEWYDSPADQNLFDSLLVGCASKHDLLGFDEYEQDYYGLSSFDGRLANEEADKRVMRKTKPEMLELFHQCSRLLLNYVGVTYRYDCLEASLKVLREQNDGALKIVRRIEELYNAAAEENTDYIWNDKQLEREWNDLLDALPAQAWIG